MQSKSEPRINEALREALKDVLTISEDGRHIVIAPMPHPITHGQFNRRMFLEAFLFKAGAGVSISPEDIMEHGNITEKEFPIIVKEFIEKGVIIKEDNVFNVEMYKLNMDINVQALP
jgi:hypothetical protein